LNTPRKSLVDVLRSSRDELARAFDEAEVAGDLVTLPRGTYRCRLADGTLDESKGGTPGYTLVFTIDDGEHKGRKLWHTCWLTPAALPMSKRDLGKLGIAKLDQLERPFPACFLCDVKVVVRADDDGTERNRVSSFEVVGVLDDPTADPDFGAPMPAAPPKNGPAGTAAAVATHEGDR
jgi:hypothetical protein